MPYAQTNYLQAIGIPPTRYTIAQTGCFLTSFANLLTERFGKPIDPVALNTIFRDRGIYIDVDDGVRDDLAWSSITAYDGSVTVVATGAGYPSSDNSIVKFVYTSKRTGAPTTHFCLVASAADKTIIDSWDGKVKPMSAYGVPAAYASYANATPQAPAVIAAPSPAANAGKQLFLPASAGTWRVYPLGGPYTIGNEKGKLSPGSFPPGLTYDILDTLMPNVYKIHTDTFGDVGIYAGPDTIAQFIDKPAPTPQSVVEPAPTPAPDPTVTITPTNDANTVSVTVPVTEPTPSPEFPVEVKDWKTSFKINKAGDYRATEDYEVTDLAGLEMKVQLHKGDLIHAAGTFVKDDVEYVRSLKSEKNGYWYGIPLDKVEKIKSDDESEAELNNALDELFGGNKDEKIVDTTQKTTRNILITIIGYTAGILDRIRGKNKNKEPAK